MSEVKHEAPVTKINDRSDAVKFVKWFFTNHGIHPDDAIQDTTFNGLDPTVIALMKRAFDVIGDHVYTGPFSYPVPTVAGAILLRLGSGWSGGRAFQRDGINAFAGASVVVTR